MYEKKIEEEKNKEYFRHLKAMKPYYKVKEWEADYQKQVPSLLLVGEVCANGFLRSSLIKSL